MKLQTNSYAQKKQLLSTCNAKRLGGPRWNLVCFCARLKSNFWSSLKTIGFLLEAPFGRSWAKYAFLFLFKSGPLCGVQQYAIKVRCPLKSIAYLLRSLKSLLARYWQKPLIYDKRNQHQFFEYRASTSTYSFLTCSCRFSTFQLFLPIVTLIVQMFLICRIHQ